MARISLRSAISETLINRFTGLASSSSKSPAQALTQGASKATIGDGLRLGARTFAQAVQTLNSGITFLNASKDTLGQLGEIADDLIAVTEEAALSSTGSDRRRRANAEFQRLSNQFQKVVENSKVGERELLTVEGISDYLTLIGLDKDKSESIAAIFDEFVVPRDDDALASEQAQGPRPVRIPPGAYTSGSRVTVEYNKIFDENVNISSRANAYKVLNDLHALKDQIDDNVKALDDGISVIGDNIDLVRAAGFAFLDLSEQLTSSIEADQVASQLRDRIRRDAPAALAQAENLEPIIVAMLALNVDDLKIS